MSTAARRSLIGVWVIVATLGLTKLWLWLWYTHGIGPTFPDAFSSWAADAYRANNAEDIADLETLLMLGSTFIVVSLVTWVALRLMRRFK